VLNIVRHEVQLYCLAEDIPDHLVVDLTGLDIGDSVHISAVKLPEGARPTITDRDFTIATIAAPAGIKSEAEEKAEAEAAAAAAAPVAAAPVAAAAPCDKKAAAPGDKKATAPGDKKPAAAEKKPGDKK
jgi:large subunit ribosomal protein L25